MSRAAIPEVVYEKIDRYVDSLAPQIQPQIAEEIDVFQQKTIDSLDDKIVDAFQSLFEKKRSSDSRGSRDLNQDAPDSYGIQSLPFADELLSFTRSVSTLADGATDDLQDIFNLTEGHDSDRQREVEDRSRGGSQNDSFRSFLSAAVDAIKDNSHSGSSGSGRDQDFALDGLIGIISTQIKETTRNPEEKARLISPEIKEKVGSMLREQHAPLAEQFTKIALDHIKKWLRGNTSTRDLGDGFKGELTDMVSSFTGMFGKKKHEEGSSRGVDDDVGYGHKEEGHGFSNMISEKLSTGLAKVHREVRLEFRTVLGGIEKSLFEALPDQFQGPLEKILGGNPFDESLGSSQQSGSRGLGDELKDKVIGKIRNLVRKVQETLRQHVLTLVNGGHRKFERQSWVFVQQKVESKVQKYLPNVRINVPDDIGNEGVSVGKPQESSAMHQPAHHQGLPQQPSHQEIHPYDANVPGQAQQYHAQSSHHQSQHPQDFGYSGAGGSQSYQGGPSSTPPYGRGEPAQDYGQHQRY
ncbi:unnamed protein product [Discula destructiva]